MTGAASELLALTRALQSEVRRAGRRGVRAVAAPPGPLARESPGPASEAARAATAARAPARAPAPAPAPPPSPAAVASEGPNVAVARACADLEALREAVAGCRACGLCESRTQTVFADGRGAAGVLFVGEAPGFHEDQEGVPFVGQAGQLLTDIVQKGMGLARSEVFIANVLKCRPPENRDPTAEEKGLCTPFLDRQIELVDPRVVIPLGRHAANHVLRTDASLSRLRGRVHRVGGRAVVPTFHPAYLLRNPSAKRDCWRDIQLAMGALGLERPR